MATRVKQKGIQLPSRILDEITDGDTERLSGSDGLKRKKTTISRKDRRKQDRQNKKGKRKHESTQENDNKRQKVNVAKRVESDDESDDFDDFDSDTGLMDDDADDDNLINKSSGRGSQSAEDTMAALRALKSGTSGPKSAEETMAALKAAKEKKATAHSTVAETMAALKAAKERKNVSKLKPEEGASAQKSVKKKSSQTLTAEETMAALKAAKNANGASKTNGKSLKKSTEAKKSDRLVSEREKVLMAQDEVEMEYYAKQLGLKSMKLSKSGYDDGLDELLGDLDFDEFAEGSGTENSDNDFDTLDHDDESEEELDEEDWDALNTGSEDQNSGEEEDDEDDEEDEEEKPVRENPYIAPVQGKYVPPSKRKLLEQSEGESEEIVRLRRQVKGHLNRLSDANIGTILRKIEALYLTQPRSHMNSIVTTIIIESTALQGTLLESFLVIHAAFASALYRTSGVDFGAYFVQTLVETFEKKLKEGTQGSKEASNLLSLLSEIYTFQMISCGLMYDFIRLFLGDINEQTTELLLKVVRNAGSQLRSDDPAALKEIIYLLQTAVSKADPTSINSRTKFLIESITALKNNRQKAVSENTISATQKMKKFLGSIAGVTSEPLQVSLDDIHNVETRGKWWLVGAAWNNNGVRSSTKGPDVDMDAAHEIIDAAEPSWIELARQQRMNTDIRRAIFIALMSSDDYVDSYERLQKLRLKSKQEREIPRVVLHCCGSEDAYNPFYALVATKLCDQHSIKKTFQFCLWDFISELQGEDMDDDSDNEGASPWKPGGSSAADETERLRRISHLARFYASIVAAGSMTLDILKVINFLTAVTDVKIFLEFFFVSLFEQLGKKAERSTSGDTKKNGFGDSMFGKNRDSRVVLQLLVKTKDRTVLRGVQYFQRFVVTSSILPAKEKQKDRVLWVSSVVTDMVEAIPDRRDE